MKRPRLTRIENNNRIAAAGRLAAGRKFDGSRRRVDEAMLNIEQEVEQGLRPHAGRKVTVVEVLSRADKDRHTYARPTSRV